MKQGSSKSARLVRLSLVVCGAVAGGVVAWRWCEPPQDVALAAAGPAVALDFVPSEAQKDTLKALRARLGDDQTRFPVEEARRKTNAKLFTYLAATSDEPRVVEAALEAISSAYSPRSTQKEAPDADLDRVLLEYLPSSQPKILAAALSAARIPLMGKPSDRLLAAVAARGSEREDVVVRYSVVDVLNLVAPARRNDDVLRVFEAALAAREAHLVASGLEALTMSLPALSAAPARAKLLAPRVLTLTQHGDPGVRGRALELLVGLEGTSEHAETFSRARAALGDSHPFVRAAGASVLARLGQRSAVHELAKLVDDKAPSQYETEAQSLLEEKPMRLVYGVPGRRHVSENALYALSVLSQGELAYSRGGPNDTPERWDETIVAAKAWYERVRASIPREP